MPGKGRPRPQKVLRAEVFPICPSTDPLSIDGDPPREAMALAYLSEGDTTVDTTIHSDGEDAIALVARGNDVTTFRDVTVSTRRNGDEILAGIARDRGSTTVLHMADEVQRQRSSRGIISGQALPLLPATYLTAHAHEGKPFRGHQVTPTLGASEPAQYLTIEPQPSTILHEPLVNDTATSIENDGTSALGRPLEDHPQSQIESRHDSSPQSLATSRPRTMESSWSSHSNGIGKVAAVAAAESPIQRNDDLQTLSHPNANPATPTAKESSGPLHDAVVSERTPLMIRPRSMRRSSRTDSSSPAQTRSSSPFEPANRSLTTQSAATTSPESFISARFAPLAPLRAIFGGRAQPAVAEVPHALQSDNHDSGRIYQNITAQGSSNNVFGDQVTHIYERQSTAVTATVATSCTTSGFLGGIFASKALSQVGGVTTVPAPASKATAASALSEPSFLSSAADVLNRIIYGPPPPPDPGPVKIGELTKDCLQAMLGGNARLQPAPHNAATESPQHMDPMTQAMLTRMVAETVLTAASLPRR